jgi:hypothetical protein
MSDDQPNTTKEDRNLLRFALAMELIVYPIGLLTAVGSIFLIIDALRKLL